MSREWITSRSNPLVGRLKKLNGKRAARRGEGVFCGEGPKLLHEAVKWYHIFIVLSTYFCKIRHFFKKSGIIQ